MKINKNDKKIQKITKTLTLLNRIAAKIMNNYKQIPEITKNHKNIDIFEYDCSENNKKYAKQLFFCGVSESDRV